MPRVVRDPERAIMNALMTKEKMSWSEIQEYIEKNSKLGKLGESTLSVHLRELIGKGHIEVEYDPLSKPSKRLYKTGDPYTEQPGYFKKIVIKAFDISQTKNRKEAKESFNEALEVISNLLINEILYKFLVVSMSPEGMVVREHAKKINTLDEQLADISSLWNKKKKVLDMTDLINAFFFFVFKNPDIAFEGETPSIGSFLYNEALRMDKLEVARYIEKILKAEKTKEETKKSATESI